MEVQQNDLELHNCEKYVVDREEGINARHGLRATLKKRRYTVTKQIALLSLSYFGKIGFLALYLLMSIKSRENAVTVYRNKILFDDHRTKVIQKQIFKDKTDKDKYYITYKQFNCPLYILLSKQNISSVLRSFTRTKPFSPLVFNALCDFWLCYINQTYLMARLNISGVLVVDDFSAKRVALVLAAKELGLRTGLVKFTDEPMRDCPFTDYDVLFCWNHQQSSEAKGKYKVVSHLNRSFKPVRQLEDINNRNYNIGIALKSHYNHNGLVNLISQLNMMTWVNSIVVRFHPSKKPVELFCNNKKLNYIISDDDSELYFKRIDLLVSGSTSLIKDALLAGVPVVYDPFLDTEGGKDFYSYVKEGIVYNLNEKEWDIKKIKEIDYFYQAEKWKEKRKQWVSYDPDAISIDEALKQLE